MMTVEKLKELVFRKPFRPVRISLKSGEAYEMRHPETLIVTSLGCVLADESQELFVIFDADQVTSVRYVRNARARK
ncbi:MAG: hypothetical protein HY720_17405 [Planctomycetes bacterium]|nr:hypothetical protein [Planctomycetota bacterium]